MADMNVYQPPQPFMQKFNDPSFFNHEYEKYKAHLASSNEEDATPAVPQTPEAIQRGVSDISDDRNQEDISSLPQATGVEAATTASSASRDTINEGQYANVTGNSSKEEMINISSCEFPQFKAFMGEKYGADVFDQGFAIIKQNQDIIFEDNGEQRLTQQLSSLLPDGDLCSGFINYCTTYLIVQNMNVGA